MGITVINFIRGWLSYVFDVMHNITIFEAYPPLLNSDISLFDLLTGVLTITILLHLLGLNPEDYDDDKEDE